MASVSQLQAILSNNNSSRLQNSGLSSLDGDSASTGRNAVLSMECANSSRDGSANTGRGNAPSSQRGGPLLEKFRAILKKKEDELNVPLSDSEVVSLYRNALSELTFNSKPVITDLTIIAGELSYLAKEITSTVCNHILEVPVDQKLPSLYLLDSIVKNIGGDYVEFFSSRLAEVFIKSYQEVDPNLYNSMRHLFRTWRDVFHPRPLHVIETELDFLPTTLPSSGTASSRAPEQRPSHSIHVNPKYLAEARHQLQHSSMADVPNSEINEELSSPEPEPERLGHSLNENTVIWRDGVQRHNIHHAESAGSIVEHGYGREPSSGCTDQDFSLSPPRVRPGRPPSPLSRVGVPKPTSPLSRLRPGRIASSPLFSVGRDPRSVSPPRMVIGRNPRVASPPVAGFGRDPRVASLTSGIGRDTRVASPSHTVAGRDPSPSRSGGRAVPSLRGSFVRTPSPSGIGMGKKHERIVEPDNGWEKPWHGRGEGDYPRSFESISMNMSRGQRNGYSWQPHTMPGALIDAYGNYRGQRSSWGPFPYSKSSQETEIPSSKMFPGTWKYSEEEEYSWEDTRPSTGSHGRASGVTMRNDDFTVGPSRMPSSRSDRRFGVDSSLPDDWHMNGSFSQTEQSAMASKDLDEHRSHSRFPTGSVSRNDRNVTFETSLSLNESQRSYGHGSVSSRSSHLYRQSHGSLLSSDMEQQNFGSDQGNSSEEMNSFSVQASNQPAVGNNVRGRPSSKPSWGKPAISSANFTPSAAEPAVLDYLPASTRTAGGIPFSKKKHASIYANASVSLSSALRSQQSEFYLAHQQPNLVKHGETQISGSSHSQVLSSESLPAHRLHCMQPDNQLSSHHQTAFQPQVSQELDQMALGIAQDSQLISTASSQHLNQQQQVMYPHISESLWSRAENISSSKPGVASECGLLPLVPNNLSQQDLGIGQPPLPPGPPPHSSLLPSSSSLAGSISLPSSLGNVTSLLSSLVAQGVISATVTASSFPSVPVSSSMQSERVGTSSAASGISALTSIFSAQDPNDSTQASIAPEYQFGGNIIGTQFNSDKLKIRHEYVLRSLYEDLPRQCTACGLRFKLQEDHSSHMDWHVSKNRSLSKNRKQKVPQAVSRKWFPNFQEWISGTEVLTSEVILPFSPTETVIEKKEHDACVPADENQNVCALCGELFDDFYSDERDEWMYKGAVYMNAPNGDFEGRDKSELGPIVHAKCRSETAGSTFVSYEDEVDANDQTENRSKKVRYA
eukprot:TRINITY_DN1422_c0_g1_i2.p1 TRINITY_DN1422_c0_g1~~TRINITY_DN1422_c0_g1_i2.p1  ORF type:complete len:1240 (-),score=273.13 TRINITY_DN1422_c0_g1_i2:275-3994(-)